jgi:predicted ATP-dependent endonuclease of OLD family
VSLEDIDAIRIFRLRKNPEGIPARSVTSVTLRDIASRYGAATGKAIAEEDVLRRLHYVDDVMRESFFADAVVLVEGEGDLGLIAAACALAGVDLEAKGIIVVPCSGKTNIMLAVSILSLFGIKHYAIFDADEGQAAQIAENKAILTLLGIDLKTADVLAVGPTKIEERFSMLKPDAESVLRSDLGDDLYERCTKEAANFYGVSNAAKVLKNPVTARYAIERAHEAGGSAAVFEAIAKKIGQIN